MNGTEVHATTLEMQLNRPFYGCTLPFDINKGDFIEITADGEGRWDNYFVGTPNEFVTPQGVRWTPAEMNKWNLPEQFLVRNAPIASLIGVIGPNPTWDEEECETIVRNGSRHFGIGKHVIVKAPCDGKLSLGMNERWRPGAWNDNSGTWTISVKVTRP
ncbi:MAG: hypothetical protein ABIH26_00560 [Candidatus Eisenbacteria bacterium]